MQRIGSLVAGLFILSIVFAVVETLFAANPEQPRLRRTGLRTDVVYWFLTPLVTKSISQIGLAIILIALYRRNIADIQTMLIAPNSLLAKQPLLLQAIEMVVVGDFISYWVHRWFHRSRMWSFHAVHHSSSSLDWLSAARVHPVNEWLSRWIQVSVLVVLGFNPMAVAAYLPFLTFYAIFIHANVSWGFGKFGWLIASPKFHRWHHTSEDEGLDKNFAVLFPWIDILFGTYTCRRTLCRDDSASKTITCRRVFGASCYTRSTMRVASGSGSCSVDRIFPVQILKKFFFLTVLLASAAGCSRAEFQFERIEGNSSMVPLKLTGLQGTRDGATVHVQASFADGNDTGQMTLVLQLNPTAECRSGTHRVEIDGQTTEGPVECSSVSFLGGQNALPSVGGVFILKDAQSRPVYRVRIPTTTMTRRQGSP